jgi:hypothetical protein
MQRLEVSSVVQHTYMSLGGKGLTQYWWIKPENILILFENQYTKSE